ncbi:MAG: hypothetical protein C0594_01045 [Marinilabiliales bacterium]|nr:MAG: hypothetical protein C0594_01045 [Marinilabiliales bacterium]
MNIIIDIAYYPLLDKYSKAVDDFLKQLDNSGISYQTGATSTLVHGDYDRIMPVVNAIMKDLMKIYPSVFSLRISNVCKI